MIGNVEEEIRRAGHGPGGHRWLFNNEDHRVCETCTHEEETGTTCLVCLNEGTCGPDGERLKFTVNADGIGDLGPLCETCLADFRQQQTIMGYRITDCGHRYERGRCAYCGRFAN